MLTHLLEIKHNIIQSYVEEGRADNGFQSTIRFSTFFFFNATSNKVSPCVNVWVFFFFSVICFNFYTGDTYLYVRSVMTSRKTDLFQPFEYIYQYIELKEVSRQLTAGEN